MQVHGALQYHMQSDAAVAGKLQRGLVRNVAHIQQPAAQAGLSEEVAQEVHGNSRMGVVSYDWT
jgi:hypothetical protein